MDKGKIKNEFRNLRDNSKEVNNDRSPPLVRTTKIMVTAMIMIIWHRFDRWHRVSDKVHKVKVNSRVWVNYRDCHHLLPAAVHHRPFYRRQRTIKSSAEFIMLYVTN